jgi:hypothetical protein
MMNFLTINLLRFYLYLVLGVLFASFCGSLPEIITVFTLLSTIAFFVWIVRQRLLKCYDSPNLVTNFMTLLFVWLFIQRFGALMGLPFFEPMNHWTMGMEFYQTLWSCFVGFLVSQHLLKTRSEMLVFIKFWIFSSVALAVCFIYLFYSSGVPVEALSVPSFFAYFGASRFQPNNLIDLFIPGSFFALSIVFYNHRRKLSHADPSKAMTEMILYLMMACILVAAVLYTRSRAGIVAFGLGVVVYFFLFIISHRRKKGVIKIVGITLLIILGALSLFGMREVFQELLTIKEALNSEISTIGTRSMGIGAAWQLITRQGALGVGVGNFQMGWLMHHSAPFTSFPQVSFNDLLWFWAEMGFVGFCLFTLIVLATVLTGFFLIKKTESHYISYLSASIIASLIAFLGHSCIDVTFYVAPLMAMFFLLMGLIFAFKNMENSEVQEGIVIPATNKAYNLFTLICYMLIGLILSFQGVQSMRAKLMTLNDETAVNYVTASEIDQSASYYPRKLSFIYFTNYLDSGKEEDFIKAIDSIDDAIRRSPFSMIYYSKRAEMFLERQDLQGIEASFALAKEYAPDFYLVDLAATAFYMNVSLELVNSKMLERFQALALNHYANAMKLNPRLNKNSELFPMLNSQARQTFEALLE